MYNQLPDLESLRCFVAAAQTNNFRKAAKLVYLSPSAFTERIQKLERHMNVPLFIRSTRQISLSAEGMHLLSYAKELLSKAQNFHNLTTEGDAQITLTLGTRYELGLSYLLPFLEQQQDQRPHQTIHLFFGDAPSLTEALLSSHIDLAFSSMRLDHPQLQSHTTHEEHYSLVASPTIAHKIHHVDDLQPYTLVDISSSFPLFRYCAEPHNLHPNQLFSRHRYLGTISAILYWVQRQEAVAVLPSYFVHSAIQEQSVFPILSHLTLHHDYFRVFWKRDHWAESTMRTLVEELKKSPLQ